MKRQFIIGVLAVVVMLAGAYYSNAEIIDYICKPGEGMHEDCPTMPQGMMLLDMEGMDGPDDDFPLSMLFMDFGFEGMHEDGPPVPQGMMHHDMEMMDGPGDDFPLSMPLVGLGLDEKQKEKVREIEGGLMKSTVRMKSDVQIEIMEMKDILDKDPVDMKAVESKLKKIESLQTSIKLSGIKALEEVKSKLTTGQRIKLKEMLERGPMMGSMVHERPEVH